MFLQKIPYCFTLLFGKRRRSAVRVSFGIFIVGVYLHLPLVAKVAVEINAERTIAVFAPEAVCGRGILVAVRIRYRHNDPLKLGRFWVLVGMINQLMDDVDGRGCSGPFTGMQVRYYDDFLLLLPIDVDGSDASAFVRSVERFGRDIARIFVN